MKKSLHDFSAGTDKSWAHQYIHVYQALFEPIRSKVTSMLEIGVWDGGSLRMWRDYFEKAQIHGIDIEDRVQGMAGEPRITMKLIDGYTTDTIEEFDTTFDVIIDDGPHTLASQLFCVRNYPALLNKNGILVVEDIPDPDWIPQLAEATPDHLKPFMYAIDRRIAPDRHSIDDELMFVIDLRFVS